MKNRPNLFIYGLPPSCNWNYLGDISSRFTQSASVGCYPYKYHGIILSLSNMD
ncbi:hypothetical protein YPPY66_3430 [Yersinia pestis PY-66]|uniref:Uncharacterized protein n=1 Tax=Yersinia pestis PY-08 TaxID=992134 RepID=A0AB72ZGA0_YERPE|nr:hypothetical protein YPPY01_3095 [Yersinia pestis PY-01]EIQ87948.1 hypothetical protein YPPY02_3136 [Yersinia pestis PY-02]EIQ88562.1 hypothetical protein YPPY03_3199 [Yersinia pestis PY-03]EIR00242.1 hypothetical protein YPPY04_3151 [Yersinia pestis PY-04]EIR01492.1 hypothetical protein YPPY05_3134 [Yersinia pestis PY-05]EIR04814.1 hypothetical protein YPPY06_3183 [Yersinia pestis PY-06]EIR16368.1 hypothetical protein YPPY08_3174 [Yersinia pestis PY-08]EIR30053.1 hypothetical protein YPP